MSSENHIGIRVDGAEKDALQAAADEARLPLSTWMKLVCLCACGAMDFEDLKAQVKQAQRVQVFASRCPFCSEPASAHAPGGRPGCPPASDR